jgi:hypothetical protein
MEHKEDWLHKKWRPAMGWVYMIICITDFIVFPVLWAVFQSYHDQRVEIWAPLTLEGAGLFHMAMGAVLGVAAWSRGREKIVGVAGDYESHQDYSQPAHRDPKPKRRRPYLPQDSEL